ncbi:hypothetical protein Fcan01_19073 [Folsomia candida]|uniref:Uncharacterized protein n=1 Tax=Folsomia candida TaxID=158441 RepID=A0A226DLH8_FOLCA|nr:hypothetical protein Fcan01_19073 [Folsomia candida]
MARNFICFVLSFLISSIFHKAFALNFNHNPNCLLISALVQKVKESNPTAQDLGFQYDNHLSFAHKSGLAVKNLYSNTSRGFPLWKTCCIEIVMFYDGGYFNVLEFDTWGYHNNAVVYIVFSPNGLGITKLGGYCDIAATFLGVSLHSRNTLTWFGLLCMVAMIVMSSTYDAIITTDITKPVEKYAIKNIRELLTEFGYKLYTREDKKYSTRWQLSIRKDLPNFDNYIWVGEIPAKQIIFSEFSAAAIFADNLAFQPSSKIVPEVLYFLKRKYSNVTCNIVKEIFYKRNVIWTLDIQVRRNCSKSPGTRPREYWSVGKSFRSFSTLLVVRWVCNSRLLVGNDILQE